MGKKVGIMTLYHKTYNYGAQLQAYALQKSVEKLGYECELINFQWSGIRTIMNYESGGKNVGRFRAFSQAIPHSVRLYTPYNIEECADDYDIFICGSDQIWGANLNMPVFVLPQITLSFVPEDKTKIAYAASMGGSVATERIRDALASSVARLDAISVRETSAIPFMSEMTGRQVTAVLDPTLLLPADEWRTVLIPEDAGKYILVYSIGKNVILDAAAKSLSEKLGYEVFSLSYTDSDTAGPKEFLGLIDNAEFVLTNSFHGTVFSILFHKQFLAFSVDTSSPEFSKNVRIIDLLHSVNLKDRFINDTTVDVEKRLTDTIDYNSVERILHDKRKSSMEFLNDSLKIEKTACSTNFGQKCCGCGACVQKCPVQCISLEEDKRGFLYPSIDPGRCTGCDMCKEVCPIDKTNPERTVKPRYFAAHHIDGEIRDTSSSGGIFMALAKNIIDKGGVVFGAEWEAGFTSVKHSYAETIDECRKFQLSKYVQSDMGDMFCRVENLLKSGRQVLFTGCPCQINGLHLFLTRDYPKLYTVDLVCGGITAPGLWRKYIRYYSRKGKVSAIRFRDKHQRYRDIFRSPTIQMTVGIEGVEETIASNDDLFLSPRFSFYRDCCFTCDYKGNNHFSDVTIGDFCAYSDVTEKVDSGDGESLIITRSEKGDSLFRAVSSDLEWIEVPEDSTLQRNIMVNERLSKPAQKDYLTSIFAKSSIEKLFYENKLIEQFSESEAEKASLYFDYRRSALTAKLQKFLYLGLSMNDIPAIKGKIIIYGAGENGKLTCDCFDRDVAAFIDRSDRVSMCRGLPIYKLSDNAVKKLVDESDAVTFIVTPVRDNESIFDEIKYIYKKANILTAESLVENL